jgi:hypothetical protein
MRSLLVMIAVFCAPHAQAAPCGTGDSDDDTIADVLEDRNGNGDCDDDDTDGDKVPDYLDSDDDGDGIETISEGAHDIDGVPPAKGPCDTWDGATCDMSHPGDGLPNYLDLDSDGDGIPDSVEGGRDPDGDGIQGLFDCDDCDGPWSDPDGDTILTVYELELGTEPRNPDSDGDGLRDNFEVQKMSETRWVNSDTDGDKLANALDPDDDGDGVNTVDEQADPNGDGDPSDAVDQNNDGVPAYLDTLEPDTDKDGIPDVIERAWKMNAESNDSDGDGILDGVEWNWYDWEEYGSVDLQVRPVDSDEDGNIDALDDDDDNDGLPTLTEGDGDVDGTPPSEGPCESWGDATCDLSELGDGIPNHLDDDSDGDGKLDRDESGDLDEDDVLHYLDCDDCVWPRPVDPGPDDPEDPVSEDGNCGCSSGPTGGWLALWLLPMLLLQRRCLKS